MEASKIFNNILNSVETSPLNYWISKTPFSATISLKSSIATRYKNISFQESDCLGKSMKMTGSENTIIDENNKLKAQIARLEKETLETQKSFKKELQALTNQNERLEKLCEDGKEKLKLCENDVSEQRKELIKVKKEKSTAGSDLRRIEKELEHAKAYIINLKGETTNTSEVIKAKEMEVKKLNKEKESLKKKMDCIEADLANAVRDKSETDSFPCTFCTLTFNSEHDVHDHMKVKHYHEKWSQCSERFFDNRNMVEKGIQAQDDNVETEFSEYLCFYCERKIGSNKELQVHRRKCHETQQILSDHPCDHCGAQCKDIGDLGRHRTTYHGLGTFSAIHGQIRFWCDVCNLNFGSGNQLRTHVGGFHL